MLCLWTQLHLSLSIHYSDIRWASCHLKSPRTKLFFQQLVLGWQQRKQQSFTSLSQLVVSPQKGPVMPKESQAIVNELKLCCIYKWRHLPFECKYEKANWAFHSKTCSNRGKEAFDGHPLFDIKYDMWVAYTVKINFLNTSRQLTPCSLKC